MGQIVIDKSTKYYQVIMLPEIVFGENKMPVVETAQDLIDKYKSDVKLAFSRMTNPPEAIKQSSDNRLTNNPWLQCQFLEINMIDRVNTSSGRNFQVGSVARKAYPQNIFYNTHRQIYTDYVGKLLRGEWKWLIPPDKTQKDGGRPVAILLGDNNDGYVQPGHAYEFPTGFTYKIMTRDRVSKKTVPLEATTYDRDGKIIKKEVTKSLGTIMLFGNEIEAAEAHIQQMINVLSQWKITEPVNAERHEEVLEKANAEDEQVAEIVGGGTKTAPLA